MEQVNRIGYFQVCLPQELIKIEHNITVYPTEQKPRYIMKVDEWLKKRNYTEFKPSEAIQSRYAQKPINEKFYGYVSVAGINVGEISKSSK